ncbi:MAG: glycosyltransferase [Planctomycetes bacterium]|nr:glycosyltransferase [Planctomycetota bacterium]
MPEYVPLVTVIMPTYNHGQFIGEAVESVLNQTYKNIELIIIDNYSEDNTEKIVSSFKDTRIKYFKLRNNGVIAASRNEGVRKATGRYIAFLDSDDIWLPFKLERQLNFLEENKDVGLVYGRAEIFGESDSSGIEFPHLKYVKTGWLFDGLLKRNFIGILTVLLKKECLEDVGVFDEDVQIRSAEDYDLWLRISKKYKIGGINEIMAKYRVHGANVSLDATKNLSACLRVVNKISSKTEISKNAQNNAIGKLHFKMAKEYILSGNKEKSFESIKRSVQYKKNTQNALYFILMNCGLYFMLKFIIVGIKKLRKLS